MSNEALHDEGLSEPGEGEDDLGTHSIGEGEEEEEEEEVVLEEQDDDPFDFTLEAVDDDRFRKIWRVSVHACHVI